MNRFSRYERFHWAAFNFLSRVFAYGMAFTSTVFIVLIVLAFFRVTRWDYPVGLLLLFVPLLVLSLLMIRAKPYNPSRDNVGKQ
ncbi:MAG TPA: hypothetical protein VJQ52_04390 [Steroidobacteraceae bacterium]|nr:hypothetical protein [Steroidobacteraceae bacterium]